MYSIQHVILFSFMQSIGHEAAGGAPTTLAKGGGLRLWSLARLGARRRFRRETRTQCSDIRTAAV